MRNAFGFITGVIFAVVLAMLMAPTGGFPSRPRFQNVTAVENSSGTSGTYQATSSATPGYGWNETGAGANLRQWREIANSGTKLDQACTDAGACTSYQIATRSAGVVTTLTNPVELVQQNGLNPIIALNDTDAAADNRLWYFQSTGEQYLERACTDAVSCVTFTTVNRTGNTIDDITHQANTEIFQNSGGTRTTFTSVNTSLANRYVNFDGGVMFGSGCFNSMLAAGTNNLNPWAGLTGSCLLLDATGAQTLTGLVPQVAAERQMLFIKNVDSADTITIAHESASSTASNRFDNTADGNLSLTAGTMIICIYAIVSSRWSCTTP